MIDTGCRMGQGVSDYHIPGTTEQTQLNITHTGSDIVDILRHKQNARLVVDAVLSALIGKCDQQRTRSAGTIIDADPAFFLNLFPCIIHHCHHPTDAIGSKKLSVVVVAKFQRHKDLSEEILIRVLVQSENHFTQHLCEYLLIFFSVLSCNRPVCTDPFSSGHFVHRDRKLYSGHHDKISPYLPARISPDQLLKQFHKLALMLVFEIAHRHFPSSFPFWPSAVLFPAGKPVF